MGKYNQDIFGCSRFSRSGTGNGVVCAAIPGKRFIVEGFSSATAGATLAVNGTTIFINTSANVVNTPIICAGEAGFALDIVSAGNWNVWGRVVSEDEPVLVNYNAGDSTLI